MFSPPYRQLARFAGNLAISVQSALSMPKAFSLALRSLQGTRIVAALDGPVEQVKQGASLADALRPAKGHLPPFVLPAIQAGEETGRLEEALYFLERHCELLVGPANAIRNAWFIPLCIFLLGDVVCIGVCLELGTIGDAVEYLWGSLVGWSQAALIIGLLFLPAVRPYVDRLRLQLPWFGLIERDMASHRFFRILSLMYGVSNSPVDRMIETAADGVSNVAVRDELRKVAVAIRRKQTVDEAFRHAGLVLDQDQLTTIAAGEIAGKLEESFNRIADASAESLKQRLAMLEQFTYRWVMSIVAFSVICVAWRFISR